VTLTPTVSVSGDDGGYCSSYQEGQWGYDIPAVMLNGNAWALGNKFASGGEFGGGDAVSLTVTFPNVTVQPGAVVDLSFASKVQGVCYSFYHSGWNAPRLEFYSAGFLDGSAPNISPGPCWIPEGFTNTCQLPWPLMLPSLPAGGSYDDLDSQAISVQDDGRKSTRAELGAGLTDVLYGWNMCDSVDSFSARHVYNIGISDSMVGELCKFRHQLCCLGYSRSVLESVRCDKQLA
jgi:hypothetical protein